MRNSRFRQIARLEKLARPLLNRKHDTDNEWERTINGAVNHAAVLAFLTRYGEAQIDEPLSDACERCAQSTAWKDCCDEFKSLLLPGSDFLPVKSPGRFQPHTMDSVDIIGLALRHVIISENSGADEKQKLEAALASAPPWLLWFTFADYSAKLLNLTIPDLSEVTQFMRSKTNFDIWWGLPTGAFEYAPWPHGSDEPLARTDVNLLRPANNSIKQMTRRELMRERVALMKSDRDESKDHWPYLIPAQILKLSRLERLALIDPNRDFHHATIGQPSPRLR